MSCIPQEPRSAPPLALIAVALPAPIGGQVDLPGWFDGVRDHWMLGQLTDASSERPWTALAFIGRFARLAELHSTAAERRQALQRMLQGQCDPRHEGPRRWARDWSEGTRRAVRRWMRSQIDELVVELQVLEQCVDESDPAWRRAMLAALLARDDLEGMALLMVQGCDEPELLDALQQLDERGESFADQLAGRVTFEQEQLRRALAIELHQPWWTRFHRTRAH